jgi:hypothetical protein
MIHEVPDRASPSDDLTALLERLRLHPAGRASLSEVNQAHLDLLLGRIASLTDALRDAQSDETARLTARLLLADLALVAAQFRGRANDVAGALARAADGIRSGLENVDPAGSS